MRRCRATFKGLSAQGAFIPVAFTFIEQPHDPHPPPFVRRSQRIRKASAVIPPTPSAATDCVSISCIAECLSNLVDEQ